MITSLFLVSNIVHQRTGNNQHSSSSTIDQSVNQIGDRISDSLKQFMDTGQQPPNYNDRILVFSHKSTLPVDNLLPAIPFGNNYLHIVTNADQNKIRKLYLDNSIITMLSDQRIDYTSAGGPTLPSTQKSTSYQAQNIIGASKVHQQYGYTGKGVKIGIVDSGVDFGVSDLSNAAVLDSKGYLASFDVTGTGVAITSQTLQPIVQQGKEYLPLKGKSLDIFIGERGTIQTTADVGIQLENLEMDGIPVTSVSGNYKVGIAYQGALVQGLTPQYFLFVLVDSQTAGVYDRMYVDMETSLAFSFVQGGIILPTSRTYIDLTEFSISNDQPFGPNNPIPAKDLTGDGVNDVSMGGLATVIDYNGISGTNLIQGIDPQGRGIGMMFDPVGHGTLTASSAASDGNTPFPIFDNKNTVKVENATHYKLPGSAPDAKIVAHKAFSLSDFILGWYFTGGLRPAVENNTLVWKEDPTNLVDISSNSWGTGEVAPVDTLKGFDPYSLLLDYWSTANSLYDGYPGMIFVVSAGNGGPGWGTAASPGMASMALTVGASNYYHYLNRTGRNDLAWFSARGPSSYGTIKPDVLAPGDTGFVDVQVIRGNGNGTYASDTFGGTSEAAPRVAGALALMVEAFRNHSITPTFEKIRLAVKSTATDLGYHPAQQGAGLLNIYDAIKTIEDNDIIISSPYSSKLAAQNLQPAFLKFANENHPLTVNPIDDVISVVTPEQLNSGITLNVRYSNGTLVNTTNFNEQIRRQDLVDTYSTSFTTTQANIDKSLQSVLPSVNGYDTVEISFTIGEDSWNAMLANGVSTPNITIYDAGSNDLVANIISFNTWSQLLDIGFPQGDFKGEPRFMLTDPGFRDSVSGWQGLNYSIRSRLFQELPWNGVNITNSFGQIQLVSSNTPNEFMDSVLEVTFNSTVMTLPIVISPTHKAQFANNITEIGSELDVTQVYAQNKVENSFDWGYRPESGEFNRYKVTVPGSATYLASFVRWSEDGLVPNMYLFNSTGNLITKSDVTYVGNGFYQSSTSEPNSQNLLIKAKDTTYYLMIQTTQLPHQVGPYDIHVFFRYLTLAHLPLPDPKYIPSIQSPVSGSLTVDASNYSIDQFPEFRITSLSAQIYQGKNATINRQVNFEDLQDGVNSNFIPSQFDDVVALNFTAGSKVDINLNWNGNADVDMYVYQKGTPVGQSEDLLKGTGSAPGSNFESASFAAEQTATYLVYIDYVDGLSTFENLDYRVSYDSRTGPTITAEGDQLSFATSIFPDGNYGMILRFQSNFGFEFITFENITTSNNNTFDFNLLKPSERQSLSGDASIEWSSTGQVLVDAYLLVDGAQVQIASDVTQSSFVFDTRLYSNGQSKLIVVATNQVSSLKVVRDVVIANTDQSTLPSIASTNPRSLPLPFFMVLFAIVLIPITRKIRNKQYRY